MSIPQSPKPAKLVISVMLMDKRLTPSVAGKLEGQFGPIDMVSPWFPFDFTSYYEAEMGKPLVRRFVVFRDLIQQDALAGTKRVTNAIEAEYLSRGKRRVNLDPGYLVHARFVLATGKDYSHRIYIGNGIYADLTLIYQEGEFRPLPWTYPDYASEQICAYLIRIRNKYGIDIKRTHIGTDQND